MTNRQIDEEAIFHIARDLADTAKRSEYLQQVCGGDQELRERIQGLLDAHEKEQTFLKSNVQLETTAAKAPLQGQNREASPNLARRLVDSNCSNKLEREGLESSSWQSSTNRFAERLLSR